MLQIIAQPGVNLRTNANPLSVKLVFCILVTFPFFPYKEFFLSNKEILFSNFQKAALSRALSRTLAFGLLEKSAVLNFNCAQPNIDKLTFYNYFNQNFPGKN